MMLVHPQGSRRAARLESKRTWIGWGISWTVQPFACSTINVGMRWREGNLGASCLLPRRNSNNSRSPGDFGRREAAPYILS